jgi:hypothetical protein
MVRDNGTGSQHTHLDPTRDVEDGMGRVRNRGDRKTEERREAKKPEMGSCLSCNLPSCGPIGFLSARLEY